MKKSVVVLNFHFHFHSQLQQQIFLQKMLIQLCALRASSQKIKKKSQKTCRQSNELLLIKYSGKNCEDICGFFSMRSGEETSRFALLFMIIKFPRYRVHLAASSASIAMQFCHWQSSQQLSVMIQHCYHMQWRQREWSMKSDRLLLMLHIISMLTWCCKLESQHWRMNLIKRLVKWLLCHRYKFWVIYFPSILSLTFGGEGDFFCFLIALFLILGRSKCRSWLGCDCCAEWADEDGKWTSDIIM